MSVLIKHMAMPKGCIYANDKDQTEYCPLLNHDDVPFCQYIENEPEIAIGIDERPVYCPISDVPEPCQDTVSRQAAIDETWKEPTYADPLNVLTEVRDRIKALPSAQPEKRTNERTETHSCDLINRQALMKEFSDFVRASNNSDFAQTPTWNDAVSLVGSMPSAQPERKKGHWKLLKNGDAICSECGFVQVSAWDMDGWDNFCHHCGSYNGGEQNEND